MDGGGVPYTSTPSPRLGAIDAHLQYPQVLAVTDKSNGEGREIISWAFFSCGTVPPHGSQIFLYNPLHIPRRSAPNGSPRFHRHHSHHSGSRVLEVEIK